MTKIYMVRHGESTGNVWPDAYTDDYRNFLSPYGVKQAELCGAYFKRQGIEFDVMVSSKLNRARHTMACIMHEMGTWKRPWVVEPALDELHGATFERRQQCRLAFMKIIGAWDRKQNMLVVTHYYTMQNLFEALGVNPLRIDGEGKVIRNAVPFVWDSAEPSRIRKLDLHHMGDQH